ncbi:MAG TPA: xanthine dehydrogenase family protein subunit M [Drouetiella sp.]
MRPFAFMRAEDLNNAKIAATDGGAVIAGGTTLVDLMQLNVMRPSGVIDINKLGMNTILDATDTVSIGALVTNTTLAQNELIMREFPVLSQAILSGASPQLRNKATVGGNLLQRTRCAYFRDPAFNCNKRKPGSGCPALDGHNRTHAVLGCSDHCIATHPSDMAVALVMLDTTVVISGAKGERRVPIGEFHLLPGSTPQTETVLEPGEIITAIEIKKSDAARKSCYLKVRDRASFSFAITSAAIAYKTELGVITEARIGLGGVATKPWRATEAEEFLKGKSATKDNFRAAAEKALANAQPRKHNKYKVELAKRTMVRALEQLGA